MASYRELPRGKTSGRANTCMTYFIFRLNFSAFDNDEVVCKLA